MDAKKEAPQGASREAPFIRQNEYDYIVVGSGPGGSAVANVLTQDPSIRVLVLEAGENHDADREIHSATGEPGKAKYKYFWPGTSVPQESVNGMVADFTGGRIMGGGTSVNEQMYVRTTPHVLRQWKKAGGEQWSPENVSAAFAQLETYNGMTNSLTARGSKGELHIRQNFPDTPTFTAQFAQAIAKVSGSDVILDYNDPNTPIGAFERWQLCQFDNGRRANASVTVLSQEIINSRPNLTVSLNSTALSILFDDATNTAYGIIYLKNGATLTATAAKCVIICAGVHTPQLLMLSGIGPAQVLEQAGVTVRIDCPHVGEHLANDSFVTVKSTMPTGMYQEIMSKDPHAKYVGGAFLGAPSTQVSPDSKTPQTALGERLYQLCTIPLPNNSLVWAVMNINPRSRGNMTLQNRDPLTIMREDPQFLADPQDTQAFADAITSYVVPAIDDLHKTDSAYSLLSPAPEALQDAERLREYIRKAFVPMYHEQSFCRMGSEGEGVVNGWGEVYGAKNLVLADCSIIPYHTDGNSSAPGYAIGLIIGKHLLEID